MPAAPRRKTTGEMSLEGTSRDRILLAAKKLFASEGYDNTSTVAIARAAGTSESQLMKHFGNKEGLLEAIFDEGWNGMGYMFRAIQELPTPSEKMAVLLDLILTTLDRDPELKELMMLEGRRIRKEGRMVLLSRGYLQLVGVVDALLTEMQQHGELRQDVHIDAVRSALISMFEGMVRDQVLAKRMNFPAQYDGNELRLIFKIVLSSFMARPPR